MALKENDTKLEQSRLVGDVDKRRQQEEVDALTLQNRVLNERREVLERELEALSSKEEIAVANLKESKLEYEGSRSKQLMDAIRIFCHSL